MPAVNYVKFMRGTQDLYNSLTEKDSNTLYFVYENAQADKGKLYLGNKLISGSSSIDGNISIADISDVVIDQGITDGDVLVYDGSLDKWVSMSIAQAVGVDVFIGATAAEPGAVGLVPAPAITDRNKYLRGDGNWSEIEATLSAADRAKIDALETNVDTLFGNYSNDTSVAEIVQAEVATLLIPENAQESLDTLQEIAAWIQSHPDDAAQMNADIGVLKSDVANLNDLLNGTEADPDNGLIDRVDALETSVGTFTPAPSKYLDVSSAITYLDSSVTSLNTSVTEINDRLRWHELNEA